MFNSKKYLKSFSCAMLSLFTCLKSAGLDNQTDGQSINAQQIAPTVATNDTAPQGNAGQQNQANGVPAAIQRRLGQGLALQRQHIGQRELERSQRRKTVFPRPNQASSALLTAENLNENTPKVNIVLEFNEQEFLNQNCVVKTLEDGSTTVRLNFDFEGNPIQLDLNERENFKKIFIFNFSEDMLESVQSLNLVYTGNPELPKGDEIYRAFSKKSIETSNQTTSSSSYLWQEILSKIGIYKQSNQQQISSDKVPCFIAATRNNNNEEDNTESIINNYTFKLYLQEEKLKPMDELFTLYRLAVEKFLNPSLTVLNRGDLSFTGLINMIYSNIQIASQDIFAIEDGEAKARAMKAFEEGFQRFNREIVQGPLLKLGFNIKLPNIGFDADRFFEANRDSMFPGRIKYAQGTLYLHSRRIFDENYPRR